MFEIISKAWYLAAILPVLIMIEGTKLFSGYLKKKDIYYSWDMLHTIVVALIIFLIALWLNGYHFF